MPVYIFFNRVFIFLIITSEVWLGLWVYLSNHKKKINQLFCLFTIFNLLWIIFTYLSDISEIPNQIHQAVLFRNLSFAAGFLFFIATYFFAKFFPFKTKGNLLVDSIVLVIGMGFFLISVFTNLIVKNVRPESWGNSPIFGAGAIWGYTAIIFLTLLILTMLLQKYFKLPEKQKLKTQYFLTGVIIFAIGNFIFNVILVSRWKNFPYYYLGNYSAIFLIVFTAYAIIKRQLFNIKIVLTELLVGVIGIILLVQAFTAPNFIWKTLNGIISILFIILGYLLVKSVLREVKLKEELQKAYLKLQRLDKAKSEFISIASHQLRTPLTAIKGYVSMILEGSYGQIHDKTRIPIENIYKSSERLIKLVNSLLNISRIEAGKIKIDREMISLEDIISSIVDELSVEAKEKNIKLIWKKPESHFPKIMGDKSKIRQAILNIIDNSIKYTTEGFVSISLRINPKNKIVIEIKDTGLGMTKNESVRLFKSFSRGKAGNRFWTEGAGLGLYIAKKFIKMHNGTIRAKSEGRGKGSTFCIYLPNE